MKTHRKENFPNPFLALNGLKSHTVRGFYGALKMEEIWKDVQGYEGRYAVSSLGRVKSFVANKEIILKDAKDGGCYRLVSLHLNRKAKTFRIHKLVAIAFLGHIPSGHKTVVDHINNKRDDNRASNLQLITSRNNNSKDQKGRSSSYVGVSWQKSRSKWVAQIGIGEKIHNLGRFENEKEASDAYQKKLSEIENAV
jgi:hypothetical protein